MKWLIKSLHPLINQFISLYFCIYYIYKLANVLISVYVTVPGKRDHLGNFFKIELLLQQGRVGFELQNALHI